MGKLFSGRFSHLVQGEGPLEWPVSDDHRDVVDAGLPQHVVHFVRGESRNILTIDLQNLVTKSEIILFFESIQRRMIIIVSSH